MYYTYGGTRALITRRIKVKLTRDTSHNPFARARAVYTGGHLSDQPPRPTRGRCERFRRTINATKPFSFAANAHLISALSFC